MVTKTSLRNLIESHTMVAAPELTIQEDEGALRCVACGHRCYIKPGKAGICKVRSNVDGVLQVPGGYVAGLQVDPIEKKPFYHAFPGRDALSFGMLGCDLHCGYCQNWVTSQALRDDQAIALPKIVDAETLVQTALREHAPVVVSTYNEPLITADWAVEVFKPAREAGLTCGFVSNGNATPEVLEFIRPYVSLYKVDLKSFQDKNYRQLGCTLANVLESIQRIHEMGFWIELVTLVVPGFNDSDEEFRDMARFIASISRDIPWHITAFHPDYKMTDPKRTTVNELDRAYEAGKEEGLHFVYPGNIHGGVGNRENTYCPDCDALLIERHGFYVVGNNMNGSECPGCGKRVPGVWEKEAPVHSDGNGAPRPLQM